MINKIGGDIMNPMETQKDYQNYVNQKSPNSPIVKNCFNAFWVGGLICMVGQIIMNICKTRGLDESMSGTIVSILLMVLVPFLQVLTSLIELENLLVLVLLFLLQVLLILL